MRFLHLHFRWPLRFLPALLSACLIGGCSLAPRPDIPAAVPATIRPATPVLRSAAECRQHLWAPAVGSDFSDDGALPGRLDILVWNTQKSATEHWDEALRQWSDAADLILLQEAPFFPLITGAEFPIMVLSAGYHSRRGPTGVVSASHVMPMASCSFQDIEPWLRTPKASGISRYALTGRPDSLVVVNIHAINFSFGLGPFKNQFLRLVDVLRDHRGPILFAGDFNTWRAARLVVVNELMQSLNLQPVSLVNDSRSTVFGLPLDHVYSRGLQLIQARTESVRSSDHNPLFITVQLESPVHRKRVHRERVHSEIVHSEIVDSENPPENTRL